MSDDTTPHPEPEPRPERDEKIYELEDGGGPDACPSCARPWPSEDAVVCMHCGYNLRTNEKLAAAKPDAPAVEVAAPPPPAVLCHKGWLSWRVLTGIAIALLIFASILNGMTIVVGKADVDDAYRWADLLRMLLFVVLATGLGVFSILLTARMTDHETGDLAIGAARVGLALATAAVVWALPWYFFGAAVLYVIGAGLVYGAMMWLLFRRTPDVPRKVLPAMHLMMLIVLSLISLI